MTKHFLGNDIFIVIGETHQLKVLFTFMENEAFLQIRLVED